MQLLEVPNQAVKNAEGLGAVGRHNDLLNRAIHSIAQIHLCVKQMVLNKCVDNTTCAYVM